MLNKVVPFLACIAVLINGVPAPAPAVLAGHGYLGGESAQHRSQDNFGNYKFGYQIVDGLGATNGREESGDGYGNKVGSYNLADIDGRVRRVDYVADDLGFRATINTNEPGTVASDTAAATYLGPAGYAGHGPAVLKGGPAVVAAAPAVLAPAVAAPIAYGKGGYGGYGLGLGGYGGLAYGGYGGLGYAGHGGLGYAGYGGLGYAGYGGHGYGAALAGPVGYGYGGPIALGGVKGY
jgi:hypothetical protein